MVWLRRSVAAEPPPSREPRAGRRQRRSDSHVDAACGHLLARGFGLERAYWSNPKLRMTVSLRQVTRRLAGARSRPLHRSIAGHWMLPGGNTMIRSRKRTAMAFLAALVTAFPLVDGGAPAS